VDPTVIIPRLRRLCVEEDRFLLHLTAPLLEELSSEWFEPPSLLSFCPAFFMYAKETGSNSLQDS
jgi:hypothetical protein